MTQGYTDNPSDIGDQQYRYREQWFPKADRERAWKDIAAGKFDNSFTFRNSIAFLSYDVPMVHIEWLFRLRSNLAERMTSDAMALLSYDEAVSMMPEDERRQRKRNDEAAWASIRSTSVGMLEDVRIFNACLVELTKTTNTTIADKLLRLKIYVEGLYAPDRVARMGLKYAWRHIGSAVNAGPQSLATNADVATTDPVSAPTHEDAPTSDPYSGPNNEDAPATEKRN